MQDDLDFNGLALIAGGHTAFQLFWAGIQLGVFGLLSKSPGLSKAEIGKELGLAQQPTRILMTGLTALKLVIRDGDAFRNAAIVEQIFVPGKPEDMSDVMGWQYHIVYPAEMDFVESLRQNTNVGLRHFPGTEDNLYQRLAHDPRLEKVFQDAMSALSRANNQLLPQKWDLSKVHHLVDAGGGNATNAINLARANPHLRITVFDAPTVCALAEKNIAQAGLSDRVKTHPGNFFVDPFPSDADCILFCHMLTIWSAEKDTALLRRVYEALPPGGTVAIFNMMGWDDETGPMTAALGSPYFLAIATGQGMMYTWREYESFLAAAGFRQTLRTELPRDHGVLVGVK